MRTQSARSSTGMERIAREKLREMPLIARSTLECNRIVDVELGMFKRLVGMDWNVRMLATMVSCVATEEKDRDEEEESMSIAVLAGS